MSPETVFTLIESLMIEKVYEPAVGGLGTLPLRVVRHLPPGRIADNVPNWMYEAIESVCASMFGVILLSLFRHEGLNCHTFMPTTVRAVILTVSCFGTIEAVLEVFSNSTVPMLSESLGVSSLAHTPGARKRTVAPTVSGPGSVVPPSPQAVMREMRPIRLRITNLRMLAVIGPSGSIGFGELHI